jgi:hypothetical protein
MKANNIFKAIFLAVAVLFSANLLAQPTLPGDYVSFQKTGEETDTVTVGSRMAYKMEALSTAGLTFEYKWQFTGGGSHTWKIKKLDDSDEATTGTGADFYKENEISVVMPATPGAVTLTADIQSLFGVNVMCSTLEDTTVNIRVVPAPTLAWSGTLEMPVCIPINGSIGDVLIPITLTGYGQWEVSYTIRKMDYDGSNPGSVSPLIASVVGTTADRPETTAKPFQLNIAGANFSGEGRYDVVIDGLTDRISRKSLDAVDGSFPNNNAFSIYVYPMPTTQKLQHVKNM